MDPTGSLTSLTRTDIAVFNRYRSGGSLDTMSKAMEKVGEPADQKEKADAGGRYAQFLNDVNGKVQAAQQELAVVQNGLGAVADVETSLQRMKEIAETLQGGEVTDDERADLTEEYAALAAGIDQTVANTKDGEKPLLDGSESAVVNLNSATGLTLTDEAVAHIDDALVDLDLAKGNLESRERRLEQTVEYNTDVMESYEAGRERIDSMGVAGQFARQGKETIFSNMSLALGAHAGVDPGVAYGLLMT
jgi:flagellin-like hook-associated protein FlgL